METFLTVVGLCTLLMGVPFLLFHYLSKRFILSEKEAYENSEEGKEKARKAARTDAGKALNIDDVLEAERTMLDHNDPAMDQLYTPTVYEFETREQMAERQAMEQERFGDAPTRKKS